MVRRVFQRGVVASGVQPHAGGVRERFGWRAKVTTRDARASQPGACACPQCGCLRLGVVEGVGVWGRVSASALSRAEGI